MQPLDHVRIKENWLQKPSLQKLFDILTADHGEAMVAGGAVRNALLGQSISDVDICTTLLPEKVIERLGKAGERAIPTGIEHGTVTVVIDGNAFQVTTIREDVETDGRHAIVRFGTDWARDAERRDLTINALYCDRHGYIYDPVGGFDDINEKRVRFIGDASTRIEEDALRILRFFRFFAFYGFGRPDTEGLKACSAKRWLLAKLSAERVWMELKKLLSAPDPGRTLLWMRTTNVLAEILPESAKWGIDSIPGLIRAEQELNWQVDPMLRLMAMIRPHQETVQILAKRLSFSNAERDRLFEWSASSPPKSDMTEAELDKWLYRQSFQGAIDAMRLEVVHLRNRDHEKDANSMVDLLAMAEKWKQPVFPVRGSDLTAIGIESGPQLGALLKQLEEDWIEGGFKLNRDELINRLKK